MEREALLDSILDFTRTLILRDIYSREFCVTIRAEYYFRVYRKQYVD